MFFSGASTSLCRSQKDRVFSSADTTEHRTLVQYCLAIQAKQPERQVSLYGETESEVQALSVCINLRTVLTLLGLSTGVATYSARKEFRTFYSP